MFRLPCGNRWKMFVLRLFFTFLGIKPSYIATNPFILSDTTSSLLTSLVQCTRSDLGQFILHLIRSFSWSHTALLYDDVSASPNVERRESYFTAQGIFNALYAHFGRRPYNKRFNEQKPDVDFAALLKGCSTMARGKDGVRP